MTREDITRMAREAGPLISTPFDVWCERFAALVSAAALAEESMQRLTDVQQEMVGPAINETRHHKANRMLKEAMNSDRENIIRNMPDFDFDFDFSTESQKQKPLTEEPTINEMETVWNEYPIDTDTTRGPMLMTVGDTLARAGFVKKQKPLTGVEIAKLLTESAGIEIKINDGDLDFARAIERAHGIGGEE
jgi:hypothetical protein